MTSISEKANRLITNKLVVANLSTSSTLFALTYHIDGLAQDCSNSSALAMELLQSCAKPSTCMLHSMVDASPAMGISIVVADAWWPGASLSPIHLQPPSWHRLHSPSHECPSLMWHPGRIESAGEIAAFIWGPVLGLQWHSAKTAWANT